jgi:hypothetical protein
MPQTLKQPQQLLKRLAEGHPGPHPALGGCLQGARGHPPLPALVTRCCGGCQAAGAAPDHHVRSPPPAVAHQQRGHALCCCSCCGCLHRCCCHGPRPSVHQQLHGCCGCCQGQAQQASAHCHLSARHCSGGRAVESPTTHCGCGAQAASCHCLHPLPLNLPLPQLPMLLAQCAH